ncbi:Protein CBG03682 [Caenorhabditis briggsae]|uniref:Protein CBG03682 n=1 Tax=Caenorhabditis briggsae TaxID=6238 RepID=A8WVL0_CAEBR|nr:Protein CBG03682 [Caenorhabditis briggsae]CAP24521.1 Protein CBG03682 [Caenorhabditis briggsae]
MLFLFLLIFIGILISANSGDPTVTSSTEKPTTQDPACLLECPDGYQVGKSSCYIMYPPTRANSYQASLSLCMSKSRQTLASLEKFREDIPMLQASASETSINWIYANGIGSRKERFDKKADVYSIFEQSIVQAPIVQSVGISEKNSNVSTLCIVPKFCDTPICDIEQILLTYEYNQLFSSPVKTLKPKETTSLTCIPKKQSIEVTCGSLGNIYPEPSMIQCQRTSIEEIQDLSNPKKLFSSCSKGFQRGVASCDPVLEGSEIIGYRFTCKPGWTMPTCWYTTDTCTSNYCSENGKCVSEAGERRCECKMGYAGDKCEWNLREKYAKVWTFPVFTGAIIALGGFVVRIVKRAVALGRTEATDENPQSTHQILRSYCMFVAGILVLFYSNPGLTNITPTACRFNFIAVHFCFMMAMVQWLLEAWNVNQVLRCVHLNEWETDWNGKKSWGVRIVPRMVASVLVVSAALLITFQAGWNQLAAPWTCVGTVREDNLSIWIPVIAMVIIVLLAAGAVFESNLLIKFRRPLLGYRIDLRIERQMGHEAGRQVEKCRRNEILCISGISLLIILWFLTILSADFKDDVTIGSLTVIMAIVYSVFSFYQEAVTCPEDRAMWITILQRYLPARFAPSYNPEIMWTVDEVREMYKFSERERKLKYEQYVPRNQYLYLHHRWDLRFNEILAETPQMTINEALVKVFCEEMNLLKCNNGTGKQMAYIQDTYADFLYTIPDTDPRTLKGRIHGRLELVTLAADAPIGVKLAKFFIVPGFDIFEPEIPNEEIRELNREERQRRRLRNERIQMENYRILREEAREQATFLNSSIHFRYFGNEVVR